MFWVQPLDYSVSQRIGTVSRWQRQPEINGYGNIIWSVVGGGYIP